MCNNVITTTTGESNMSKLIQELSAIPYWNALVKNFNNILKKKDEDFIDNINEDEIDHILWSNLKEECVELVAVLLMDHVRNEWSKQFDINMKNFENAILNKMSKDDVEKYLEWRSNNG